MAQIFARYIFPAMLMVNYPAVTYAMSRFLFHRANPRSQKNPPPMPSSLWTGIVTMIH